MDPGTTFFFFIFGGLVDLEDNSHAGVWRGSGWEVKAGKCLRASVRETLVAHSNTPHVALVTFFLGAIVCV